MINNACLMPHSPLECLRMDDWNRMIDVNIKGVLYGIAAAEGGAYHQCFLRGRP
jgi:NADP-dependent 3-hydroxy acid dehydrogenase YdfG